MIAAIASWLLAAAIVQGALVVTRRGGDARVLARSPEAAALARKVQAMKARLAHVQEVRADLEDQLGQPDPNREAGA